MRITNNGQLNSLYNRKSDVSFPCKKATGDIIHHECDKPLRSKWFVSTRQIGNVEPYYHKTTGYSVRKANGLWLVVDKPKKVNSDIIKEQKKLYNKLKREYEKSLKQNSSDVETSVTEQDKMLAKTRKKTISMVTGLACSPRYDRIYANA